MVKSYLLDTHCHLDEYPDPRAVVRSLDGTQVAAVAMTALPSGFERLRSLLGGERLWRLALGVHPLAARSLTDREWRLFAKYLPETGFVGEVGLDCSPEGVGSRMTQENAFHRVLQAISGQGKIVSVHSRRAEAAVVAALDEHRMSPVIFHWYSGSLRTLEHVVQGGHYFSINPAMVRGAQGQKIVERIPRERILAETDGPFVRVGSRAAVPTDAMDVYQHLAKAWRQPLQETIDAVYANYQLLRASLQKEGTRG